MLECPSCGSQRIWKDGLRYYKGRPIQRHICRSCGYRFSESTVKVNISSQIGEMPYSGFDLLDCGVVGANLSIKELCNDSPLSAGKDVGSHKVTAVDKTLNALGSYNSSSRVCAEGNEAKNLVKQIPKQEKAGSGATSAEVKGKIVEYSMWLLKEGYAETTITTRTMILKTLFKRGANLCDPESVKEAIAKQNWSESRKMNAVYAYDQFLGLIGRTWKPPTYIPTRKIPFIPTEAEIDALLVGCGKKIATKLRLIKETAMRSGEARRLKWTDIDVANRVIRVNAPEKNSNPRIYKVSQELIAMLNSLPKTSPRVFGETARMTDYKNFYCQRKRLANKLSNPKLLQISFHTLRHWKATKLYHQTKDILYVKEFLGHKNINSTLMYVQIARVMFGATANDEFTCKIAETAEEISELIESGFNYVTDFGDKKFFRKRK